MNKINKVFIIGLGCFLPLLIQVFSHILNYDMIGPESGRNLMIPSWIVVCNIIGVFVFVYWFYLIGKEPVG